MSHVVGAESEHAALLSVLNGAVEGLATNGDIDAFARELRQFIVAVDAHVAGEHRMLLAVFDGDADRHRREQQRFAETADALLYSLNTRYDLFDCWAVALYFLRWLSNHIERVPASAASGALAVAADPA